MDGDEKPLSSQRREQVLENCRWLFGQEVQLITFYHTFNNGVSNACTALILPKRCTLHSQTYGEFNSKVLFKAECKAKGKKWVTREDAINSLLWAVESKVGEILQPDIKGEFQINKSAIPEACGINRTEVLWGSLNEGCSDPITPAENGCEQRYELDGKSIRGRKGSRLGGSKRVWRIAGYTPSGEPCIEQHEPEDVANADPLSLSRYMILGASKTHLSATKSISSSNGTDFTVFTPDTTVVGDTKTVATCNDPRDHIKDPHEDAKRLNHVLVLAARAGVQLAELQQENATTTSSGNTEAPTIPIEKYQKLLGEQELAVQGFLYWISQKNQRITTLETKVKEAQDARDAEIRICAEVKARLEKESLRASQSEAREADTNTLLEKLFKNRSDARSVRSGLEM